MNDFIRPFTEEEFDEVFHDAGYPEIAKQYCYEEWQEYFSAQVTTRKEAIDNPEHYISKLRSFGMWHTETNTCREEIWEITKENIHVDDYVRQRELGRGHEWSKYYCDHLDDCEFISAVKSLDSSTL